MTHTYNWTEQRRKPAYLALEDGTILRGWSAGAPADRVGEVVFNTGMTGYQEIISDPSYAGQFVTFTCPEIGNVGLNTADRESRRIHASGLLLHALNTASNWRSESELGQTLIEAGVPALAGIDTRRLTRHLRDRGTLKGFLCATGAVPETDGVARARAWEGLDGQDYAAGVSCAEPYAWDPDGRETCSWGMASSLPPADLRIAAYDFGIKWNILRGMRRQGMQVTVVPARTPAADVLALKPDGVFLSNGPADPAALPYAAAAIRGLLGRTPVMGICLGHQLLGLALGGRTYRLKFGHHGCNHPVMDLADGTVAITSQNHNFAVAAETLDRASVEVTHLNLNDQTVEGLRCKNAPAFSVQYHPEAAPGPHDAAPLFRRFRERMGAKRDPAAPVAAPAELPDYDAILFGTPTRFGNMAAQMRDFLDRTGGLWAAGKLVGKVGSVFCSTGTGAGNESTIMSFVHTLLHHGMIYVGLPYACPELADISEVKGGSPWGAAAIAGADGSRQPSARELSQARFQGAHVAAIAVKLNP